MIECPITRRPGAWRRLFGTRAVCSQTGGPRSIVTETLARGVESPGRMTRSQEKRPPLAAAELSSEKRCGLSHDSNLCGNARGHERCVRGTLRGVKRNFSVFFRPLEPWTYRCRRRRQPCGVQATANCNSWAGSLHNSAGAGAVPGHRTDLNQ